MSPDPPARHLTAPPRVFSNPLSGERITITAAARTTVRRDIA